MPGVAAAYGASVSCSCRSWSGRQHARHSSMAPPYTAGPAATRRTHSRALSTEASAQSPATAATPPVTQQPQRAPSPARQRLKDPAHIGAKGSAVRPVTDMLGDVSLATYMRLPVEQYYILDPNQISFLTGNRFVLSVPRIELFGSWLQPTIEVEVFPSDTGVRLVAEDCKIQGNGPLSSLNGKFAMSFTTELTWDSGAEPPATPLASSNGSSSSNGISAPGSPFVVGSSRPSSPPGPPNTSSSNSSGLGSQLRQGWHRLTHPGDGSSNSGTSGAPVSRGAPGALRGTCAVDVWCEVIPPFQLMPRELLQSSCNAVLRGLVSSLLPLFLKQLSADYLKWAQDPAYRAARAARNAPLAKG